MNGLTGLDGKLNPGEKARTVHELNIVFSIIDRIKLVAVENGLEEISEVVLSVGEESGIIDHYLYNCWTAAIRGDSLMSSSKLIIEHVPAVALCLDCGEKYDEKKYGHVCPICGCPKIELLQGSDC